MIFFTADTHFGHQNIISLCGRPFPNLDAMHCALIDNWNAQVNPTDDVYILGDFYFPNQAAPANEILQNLQGRKYLIRGNHDHFVDRPDFESSSLVWIRDFHTLRAEGLRFILFHYPILEWPGYHKGTVHLYGHVHNTKQAANGQIWRDMLGARAINVGVDMQNFAPIALPDILSQLPPFDLE